MIQEELGISVAKMGLLLSAFLWAYAFAQLPVGGLIDRFGPRLLLGLGLFCWSAAQAAGGLVRSFGTFIVARLALGVAKLPYSPAEPGSCGTGSACGRGALRPVSCNRPLPSATSSRFRYLRS